LENVMTTRYGFQEVQNTAPNLTIDFVGQNQNWRKGWDSNPR
jgi:hypothetical protein